MEVLLENLRKLAFKGIFKATAWFSYLQHVSIRSEAANNLYENTFEMKPALAEMLKITSKPCCERGLQPRNH